LRAAGESGIRNADDLLSAAKLDASNGMGREPAAPEQRIETGSGSVGRAGGQISAGQRRRVYSGHDGVAFVTGALSNAYFSLHGPLFSGRVIKIFSAGKRRVLLQLMRPDAAGVWLDMADVKEKDGKTIVTNVLQKPLPDAAGHWRAGCQTDPRAGSVGRRQGDSGGS
jgi:hypothetical protein